MGEGRLSVILEKQKFWENLQFLFPRYIQNDAPATREIFNGLMEALRGYFQIRIHSKEDTEDLLECGEKSVQVFGLG